LSCGGRYSRVCRTGFWSRHLGKIWNQQDNLSFSIEGGLEAVVVTAASVGIGRTVPVPVAVLAAFVSRASPVCSARGAVLHGSRGFALSFPLPLVECRPPFILLGVGSLRCLLLVNNDHGEFGVRDLISPCKFNQDLQVLVLMEELVVPVSRSPRSEQKSFCRLRSDCCDFFIWGGHRSFNTFIQAIMAASLLPRTLAQ
jgi:hypothetical protein